MNTAFYKEYFADIDRTVVSVDEKMLENSVELIRQNGKTGGKIYILGNGGSSAMAAHVAVDLTKNAGVRALTFNEVDLITCFANDFGHENWMAQALKHYAVKGDMVILISSSGQSPNIVNAAKQANSMGLPLITLSGFQPTNPLRSAGQINFWADSKAYNTVEMTHHIWLLAICDRLIMLSKSL